MTTLLDTIASTVGSLATRRPRLLLTLLCLAMWTPGFATLPPGDRDESRFVQATKQMLETGDFVRIQNGTEARNRKPIGIHWMQAPFAAAARAAGLANRNPVWPYRIPSLLGGLAAVLACFALGERLLGRHAALLGAAMLSASVLLVVEVHIAKTDAALMGATTLAMALLARAWQDPAAMTRTAAAGFWLAMGLGVLLKGPITLMVAGLTVAALLAVERRAAWLRTLHAAWGVPLMLLVVIPWFAAIGVATGGRFFADAVGGDLGRKLTSGDDAHWGPPGLHLLLLPFLLFPLGAALPGGIALAWRERRAPPIRFLLAWIVPAWMVFEATPTKLPHYTLPLYPAVCLLLAHAVLSAAGPHRPAPVSTPGTPGTPGATPGTPGTPSGAPPGATPRGILAGALGALAALALAAAGVAAPIFLHLDPWLAAPLVLAAALVGCVAVQASAPRPAAAAVMLAPLVYAAALGWELPRLSPIWIAPRVVAALPPGRLGAVGFAEPSLMVLAGTSTQWLLATDGVSALADGAIDVLLVADRDLAAVRTAAAERALVLRPGPEIPGYNYSRGRAVLLRIFTR